MDVVGIQKCDCDKHNKGEIDDGAKQVTSENSYQKSMYVDRVYRTTKKRKLEEVNN